MKETLGFYCAFIFSYCVIASTEVADFKSRTNLSDWMFSWTIREEDYGACLAMETECCLANGKIIPYIFDSQIVFETTEGTNCGQLSTIAFSVKGSVSTTDLNMMDIQSPSNRLQFASNIDGKETFLEGTYILSVIDHSNSKSPSYAIRLPSNSLSYSDSTAFNILWVTIPSHDYSGDDDNDGRENQYSPDKNSNSATSIIHSSSSNLSSLVISLVVFILFVL